MLTKIYFFALALIFHYLSNLEAVPYPYNYVVSFLILISFTLLYVPQSKRVVIDSNALTQRDYIREKLRADNLEKTLKHTKDYYENLIKKLRKRLQMQSKDYQIFKEMHYGLTKKKILEARAEAYRQGYAEAKQEMSAMHTDLQTTCKHEDNILSQLYGG
ncbi:MAG: hypothetical protein D6707_07530 [Bacteroidetes bacterium]|nr:MAG: hypothetical protein D6707_07530 [Bacteroidota bacterium]